MRCTDIAVIGGELAGSTAAAMLGRAGISTIVIDPHEVYPFDFRVEKIGGEDQVERFLATGIAESVLRSATPCSENWIARFGRLLDRQPTRQYGILYDDLVTAVRAEPQHEKSEAERVDEVIIADPTFLIYEIAAEAEGARGRMFDQLDNNRDGALSQAERDAARSRVARNAAQAIAGGDANRDGFVSRAEAMARPYPMFDRLDADIAYAMMGINAAKAVEIGDGVAVAGQRGSEHRDELLPGGFASNHSGGTLGGISSGQDLLVHVSFKPAASIQVPGRSVDLEGRPVEVVTTGRHDPCVGLRAVPIVEAMLLLVLMDHFLRHRAQCADVLPGSPRFES